MEPKFFPNTSSLCAEEPLPPPNKGIFNFLRGALRGGTGSSDILLSRLIYKSTNFEWILTFFRINLSIIVRIKIQIGKLPFHFSKRLTSTEYYNDFIHQ
jgi:hypothetical protein